MPKKVHPKAPAKAPMYVEMLHYTSCCECEEPAVYKMRIGNTTRMYCRECGELCIQVMSSDYAINRVGVTNFAAYAEKPNGKPYIPSHDRTEMFPPTAAEKDAIANAQVETPKDFESRLSKVFGNTDPDKPLPKAQQIANAWDSLKKSLKYYAVAWPEKDEEFIHFVHGKEAINLFTYKPRSGKNKYTRLPRLKDEAGFELNVTVELLEVLQQIVCKKLQNSWCMSQVARVYKHQGM